MRNIDINNLKRGDIIWVDLKGSIGSVQKGRREAIVVQNNAGNKNCPTIIIVCLTTKIKKTYIPTHVVLKKNKYECFTSNNLALAEQILTIDKSQVVKFCGKLNDKDMKRIDKALYKSILIN